MADVHNGDVLCIWPLIETQISLQGILQLNIRGSVATPKGQMGENTCISLGEASVSPRQTQLLYQCQVTEHDGISKPQLFLCIKDRPLLHGVSEHLIKQKVTLESKIIQIKTRSVQQETLGSLFSPSLGVEQWPSSFPKEPLLLSWGKWVISLFVFNPGRSSGTQGFVHPVDTSGT